MGYPTIDAPYGFKPVNLIGGQVFSGSTREYPIAYNYGTAIFYGDFVQLSSGFVTILANTITGNAAVGVFLGCSYTDPVTKQKRFSQYYPANTTGVVTAYVITDPSVTFQAQLDGVADQSDFGANTFFAAVQSSSTGSTQTGNSNSALESTTVTTAAAFKIIGFASPVTDAFPDVLVKFNPGAHAFTNAAGI